MKILCSAIALLIGVSAQGQIPKITVRPKTTTIIAGKTKTLSRTVTVVWVSSDTTIAIVSQTGIVTGRNPGVAKISASAGPTLIATSTITVIPPPVASVTLAFERPILYVGQAMKVYATVRDADGNILTGRKVVFSSANTSVIRVIPNPWLAYAAAWPGRQ